MSFIAAPFMALMLSWCGLLKGVTPLYHDVAHKL
jgi:hypothetical protein